MQFGLIEMWNQMAAVAKTVSFLLIALSIVTLYMLIERLMTFSKSKNKSKEVAPKLSDLLKKGNIADAMTLSAKKDYKGSHLARVTAGGIREYLEAKDARLGTQELISSAERGADRSQVMFDQELRKGLPILATIATSSPFIGLFGTIFGIINAFRGMALTGSGGIGAVASGIAEALVTTALGIGLAIMSLWVYNFLNSKIEVFDAEMSNTSSQLVDFFIRKEGK